MLKNKLSILLIVLLLNLFEYTKSYYYKQIPEGFSLSIGDHSYKLYYNQLNWLDAYKKCQDDDAYLVVINNTEESEFIKNFITEGNETFYAIWAGVITTRIPKFYIDLEGNMVRNQFWGIGEPDDAGGKYFCGEVKQDGLYALYKCDETRAFICEFE